MGRKYKTHASEHNFSVVLTFESKLISCSKRNTESIKMGRKNTKIENKLKQMHLSVSHMKNIATLKGKK